MIFKSISCYETRNVALIIRFPGGPLWSRGSALACNVNEEEEGLNEMRWHGKGEIMGNYSD